MQGKKKTYLLLIAVLAIWGTIGYQVLAGFSPDAAEDQKADLNLAFNPERIKAVDTFSIQPANRDPFLGTLATKAPQRRITQNRVAKDTLQIPVTYRGLIKRQDSKDIVFVIDVNGTQLLMKKGQNIHDMTLVKGNDNNIVIRYKGAKKTIRKE